MSGRPNLKPKLGTWDGWTARPQAHRLRSHAHASPSLSGGSACEYGNACTRAGEEPQQAARAMRTGGQPDKEAIRGGVNARAMRQDGWHVHHHVQRIGQVVELRQQPGRRVGNHDAHLGEAAKVAVCPPACCMSGFQGFQSPKCSRMQMCSGKTSSAGKYSFRAHQCRS